MTIQNLGMEFQFLFSGHKFAFKIKLLNWANEGLNMSFL